MFWTPSLFLPNHGFGASASQLSHLAFNTDSSIMLKSNAFWIVGGDSKGAVFHRRERGRLKSSGLNSKESAGGLEGLR